VAEAIDLTSLLLSLDTTLIYTWAFYCQIYLLDTKINKKLHSK